MWYQTGIKSHRALSGTPREMTRVLRVQDLLQIHRTGPGEPSLGRWVGRWPPVIRRVNALRLTLPQLGATDLLPVVGGVREQRGDVEHDLVVLVCRIQRVCPRGVRWDRNTS